LSLMRRRGPDAAKEAVFSNRSERNVYLLHSRLSIIDLDERADQPFKVGTGHLTYNGEIYNYVELREQLEARGHSFRTNSDTEVLARQLMEYGWGGLTGCEGMWAFAWYDSSSESLLLSRDRFGEKPLYLYENDGIYFGSEAKFIFALLGMTLQPNLNYLWRYLVNGYKSLYKGGELFFDGLQELRPATVIEIDNSGECRQTPYWKPVIANTDESMTYEQAVSGTRDALVRSVKLRLRADVPIAFCLSGGVDSNALIGIAKRVLDYDVHGFTIMNTDARYEERDMVEATVRELGIRHTPVPVDTTDFLPNLRTLVRQHDGPVYTITYYAHWRLMDAVHRTGYKVSVSGTGADELFSGYYDHHNAYIYDLRNDPLSQAEARANWQRVVAPIVRNPFLQDPDYFVKDPRARDHIFLDAESFVSFLKHEWLEPFTEKFFCGSLLRNRMTNELFHESVPAILHEDDNNSMYYSIENRSPFLDLELFEWCQQIPTRHLIQDGQTKSPLREAVRGLAPDVVISNPCKVGFNVPIFDYLDVENAETRAQILDGSPIYEYVKKDKIESLMDRDNLTNSQSKFLFYFLNAKMFLEEFLQ
jgi:asparagine synthase (glutamine-hydrolysing)